MARAKQAMVEEAGIEQVEASTQAEARVIAETPAADPEPLAYDVYQACVAAKEQAQKALNDKRRQFEAARADLFALQEKRPALLLEADDATLAAHDEEQARAARTVERLTAIARKLAEDLLLAEHAEVNAYQILAEKAAEAAEAEAAQLIMGRYAELAHEIVTVLERLGELQRLVDDANTRRVPGSAPFSLERCRWRAPEPGRVQKVTRRAAVGRNGEPLMVYNLDANGDPIGGQWGVVEDESIVPEIVYQQVDLLRNTVFLPPLRGGEPPLWAPPSMPPHWWR
ncbi:hypothetical protein [Methylocella sp.]|uniref:hypothetical protein n=1 Tax=Methylocella sp. TaxID=1978226 RepID=UPI003784AF1C